MDQNENHNSLRIALLVHRILVSITKNISLFGVSIVFLILCADNLQDLLKGPLPDMTNCLWLLVVVAALWPFTLVGSPKEFW